MISRFVSKSIRLRIMFWYLCVLAVTMGSFSLLSLGFLRHQLTTELKKSLTDDAEVVEALLKPGNDGRLGWVGHEEDSGAKREKWIEVLHPDGNPIYRNFTFETLFSSLPPALREPHKRLFHAVSLADGEEILTVRARHRIGQIEVVITVGRSEGRLFEEMGHLVAAHTVLVPLVLLLSGIGGFFFSGRVLGPLKKIIAKMKKISADRLHERLPVEFPGDELGQLSKAFNELLEKLGRAFAQMRQFTADASHELRTPLTAIRSVGETVLRIPRMEQDYREAVSSMLEEVERMTSLVNDLLSLARSDGKTMPIVLETCDLGDVVEQEVSLLKILAEEKEQHLHFTVKDSCTVRIDRMLFRRALGNLLHNAIKFTPNGKNIHIEVGRGSLGAYVAVGDEGPGINPEHRAHVFDRFYRVDRVRSRETGGFGLGLAIAKWAVELHGGRIDLESEVGIGSTFRIHFPDRRNP